MNSEQKYLLYLINCALNEKDAELPAEKINWNVLAVYAEEQQFEQLLYPFFNGKPHGFDDNTWHHLHQRYGRVIVRDNIQDMELNEICCGFSKAKIDHIPLKGSVIKKYYPSPDIRRSNDIDILIHHVDFETASEILRRLGYEQETKNMDVHDCFWKGNLHIELHKTLTNSYDSAYKWCCMAWENSYIFKDNTYEMIPEYLYVYLLVHLRRHVVRLGGGGIKLITDIAVMRNNVVFDEYLLNQYLRYAGIERFGEYVWALAQKWFIDKNTSDENVLLLEDLILNSGAYGNYSKYLDMVLAKGNKSGNFKMKKIKNFIGFVFPSLQFMQEHYPILKEFPVLLPIIWGKRILCSEKTHKKDIVASFAGLNKSNAESLKRFCENIEH